MNADSLTDADKVKAHWGQKAREDAQARQSTAWMNHPLIEREYINRKISGEPDVNWLAYVRQKYVPPRRHLGLTLGCGDGGLERHALNLGLCDRFEAFDIAEGAIAIARERASHDGIGARIVYDARDINHIHLDAGRYDIAFCSMSVHHFAELEHVFGEVRQALKPSGLFVINEFVGPSQFQWTDRQLSAATELLRMLPARYRRLIPQPGQLKERCCRPTIDEMNSLDPSESIRSAEIIPLFAEYFEVVERIDYGGTILQMLLEDIVGNFSLESEEDAAILTLLCHFEDTLIRNSLLPSDFTFIVGQTREPS